MNKYIYKPNKSEEIMSKISDSKNSKKREIKSEDGLHQNFNIEKKKVTKTDWGSVADKYDKYLNSESNYHNEVILPNLLRVLGDTNKKNILDIACGQGYFCEEIVKKALQNKEKVNVSGFDLGEDLIKIAQKNAGVNKSNINYKVLNAENFADEYLKTETNKREEYKNENKFDIIYCVLAMQNIENIKLVLENIKKVLKEKDNKSEGGKVIFVINHPAFRIPKSTSWGNVTESGAKEVQYRRVDKYMSEDKIKMDMTPAEKRESFKKYTYSYHRPLQTYFKIFANLGFAVTKLEEWISNRQSEEGGKNSERENAARKEFPMFMCLEVQNI